MKVGINGFGRVGQALLQQTPSSDDLQIVAINEIGLSLSDAVEFLGEAASVTDSGDLSYAGRTINWLALADHREIRWEQDGVRACRGSVAALPPQARWKSNPLAGKSQS